MATVTHSKETRQAIAEYRRLLELQRAMPLFEQWTMGKALKHAQAWIYVCMEEDSLGLRR